MRVLAIDPGGTTGFASWGSKAPRRFNSWATTADSTGGDVLATIAWARGLKDELTIVCESFHISSQTHRKSQAGSLVAIELIGACRWIARASGVPFVTQTPTEAKTFATDDKLRAMNWWTKGSDHARDATRHLLLFLSKERLIDLRALVK